jgi:hypothetical protein
MRRGSRAIALLEGLKGDLFTVASIVPVDVFFRAMTPSLVYRETVSYLNFMERVRN